MIFRQLFEPKSSTYTYLVACPETHEAVLIDPVLETVERDQQCLAELGLRLVFTLETHLHADHITGAARLRERLGARIGYPQPDCPDCADFAVREGEPLQLGSVSIEPLFTPGHTDAHYAYRIQQAGRALVLTGDALLLDGCGRTDFQSGDARTLYRSIQEKLFALDDNTLVYPAHDYEGRWVSTIGQEKTRNPRLKTGTSEAEFVALMEGLDLDYPKQIDRALPGNQRCGAVDE